MRILLDAGHGHNTPGKRSPVWSDGTQLYEWELNRDIVKRVANVLDAKRIPYSIITPENEDILLVERVRRVNTLAKKEPCLLISIHANAGGGTGWEAWTSIGQTASDTYARAFYQAAHNFLPKQYPIRTDMIDGDEDKESNFYVLKNTTCPAILTENLFMDTERDCRFLMSDHGRETIAKLHVEAIEAILKK